MQTQFESIRCNQLVIYHIIISRPVQVDRLTVEYNPSSPACKLGLNKILKLTITNFVPGNSKKSYL